MIKFAVNLFFYVRPYMCPELLSCCQDGVPDWALKLLIKYPSADRLKRANVKTLIKIPYVSCEKAQQLIANTKCSVASADADTQDLIVATTQQILHFKKTTAGQTSKMLGKCSIPEIELLKSFPGIGDSSAIGLMIEIQTIKRFAKAKNLVSAPCL